MSPTRRGFLTGTAALLAGGHLAPAAAAAINNDFEEDAAYLASAEYLTWEAEEAARIAASPRKYERGVAEGTFRMEFAIDVHDENGRMLGCVPVERTGHVKLYADGGGRIALWGPQDWRAPAGYGNLTPSLHMTETFLDAETFAPLALALFGTVNMERESTCNSAVASDWSLRRRLRAW